MTRVKICGVRKVEDALAAIEAGAELLGLVFYPPSHRYLTPAEARDLVAAVRATATVDCGFVGVFVDEPLGTVNEIAACCGLDYAQVSGDETWDYCAALDVAVIRAIQVDPTSTLDAVRARVAGGERLLADAGARLLLDTQHTGFYGGTGRTFDWGLAAAVAGEYPLLLAGGLTPENVGAAVARVQPWGLDVSSGVETDKHKDPEKIRRFLAAVRSTDGLSAATA